MEHYDVTPATYRFLTEGIAKAWTGAGFGGMYDQGASRSATLREVAYWAGPARVRCHCADGACMLCDDDGMVPAGGAS